MVKCSGVEPSKAYAWNIGNFEELDVVQLAGRVKGRRHILTGVVVNVPTTSRIGYAHPTTQVSYGDYGNSYIHAFFWDGRRYVLRKPVEYSCERHGTLWVYSCSRYGLKAFAASREEALEQFNEEFAFLYDGLINEEPENLTPDAIDLRGKLSEDIKQVEAVQEHKAKG